MNKHLNMRGDEVLCALTSSLHIFVKMFMFKRENSKCTQKPRIHQFILEHIIYNDAGVKRCATRPRIICQLHFALWQSGKEFDYKFSKLHDKPLYLIRIPCLNEIHWNSFVLYWNIVHHQIFVMLLVRINSIKSTQHFTPSCNWNWKIPWNSQP